jgi:hypothetical protein
VTTRPILVVVNKIDIVEGENATNYTKSITIAKKRQAGGSGTVRLSLRRKLVTRRMGTPAHSDDGQEASMETAQSSGGNGGLSGDADVALEPLSRPELEKLWKERLPRGGELNF